MFKPVLIFSLLFAVSINANQNEEQKPKLVVAIVVDQMRYDFCLLYTSPSPRDGLLSRMPSSA